MAALLMENPEVSDMEMAEMLGMDIKQVRKVLHRLLEPLCRRFKPVARQG